MNELVIEYIKVKRFEWLHTDQGILAVYPWANIEISAKFGKNHEKESGALKGIFKF